MNGEINWINVTELRIVGQLYVRLNVNRKTKLQK